jgi:hypothetical protein
MFKRKQERLNGHIIRSIQTSPFSSGPQYVLFAPAVTALIQASDDKVQICLRYISFNEAVRCSDYSDEC